jgi:hypothetical protein
MHRNGEARIYLTTKYANCDITKGSVYRYCYCDLTLNNVWWSGSCLGIWKDTE